MGLVTLATAPPLSPPPHPPPPLSLGRLFKGDAEWRSDVVAGPHAAAAAGASSPVSAARFCCGRARRGSSSGEGSSSGGRDDGREGEEGGTSPPPSERLLAERCGRCTERGRRATERGSSPSSSPLLPTLSLPIVRARALGKDLLSTALLLLLSRLPRRLRGVGASSVSFPPFPPPPRIGLWV